MPGLLSILVGLCVTVGVILLFASGNYRNPRLWRGIASLLLAIPAASLTYLMLGIRLARTHGLSRFYSWPLGGANISDTKITLSAAFWVIVWFVLIFALSNLLPAKNGLGKPKADS
jgi:hypothetical protein